MTVQACLCHTWTEPKLLVFSHTGLFCLFSNPYYFSFRQPEALTQLLALYTGRCFSCWKQPEVMEWLERNVKLVIDRVEKNDPLIKDYETRYELATPILLYFLIYNYMHT